MDQFLTLEKAKIGPDFNSTAYTYIGIYTYIYIHKYIYIYICCRVNNLAAISQ